MGLTADEIADLGLYSFLAFGSEAARKAAFARYQRFLDRQRAEAAKHWIIQP